MSNPISDRLESLTQELFGYARDAGMALTLDQLQLLRLAMSKGYGLGGWTDLSRLCERLWVKPSHTLTASRLDAAFVRLRSAHRGVASAQTKTPLSQVQFQSGVLPEMPIPKPTEHPDQDEGDVPVAVKFPQGSRGDGKRANPKKSVYRFSPSSYPLSATDYLSLWRQMRQSLRQQCSESVLDIDASIDRISTEGMGAELVLRPISMKGLECVLLLDDSFVMKPFHWAVQPLMEKLESKGIYPGKIYRIDSYPGDALAPWYRPTQFEPLETLLTQWSATKTILVIYSDAGAAMGSEKQIRSVQTAAFLHQVQPVIRRLLWINPLPQKRWYQTPAARIAAILNGNMLSLEAELLEQVRSLSSKDFLLEA